MNEILSIHDLSVNYGGIEAVKGISFDVREGEIVTLIGANGAGKDLLNNEAVKKAYLGTGLTFDPRDCIIHYIVPRVSFY